MVEMRKQRQKKATIRQLASGKIRTRLWDLNANFDFFYTAVDFLQIPQLENSKTKYVKKK